MQIRKITHKALDDFPELKEQGYNEHDMYLVWKSYQDDISQNMLYPENPYIKFLDIGLFYLKYSNLVNRKKKIINNKTEPTSKKKIDNIIDLSKRYIEFYNTLIVYLEGYSEKAEKNIKEYKRLIGKIEKYIEELNKYSYEYHERSIASNLEEQSSDSRGNQEQNIQEGTH